MKRLLSKFSIFAILITTLSVLSIDCLSHAQQKDSLQKENWVEFDFTDKETPSEASAIIISNQKVTTTSQIAISPSEKGFVLAAPYQQEANSIPKFAVAVSKDTAGNIKYSSVKELGQSLTERAMLTLNKCSEDNVDPAMQSQLSLISNLLELRIKRRSNYITKTEQALSGDFLEKMRKYEAGFGLEQDKPLSAELTPFELVDRLDRILHTLRKISTPK